MAVIGIKFKQLFSDKELDVLVMLKNAKSDFDVFITAEFPERFHFRESAVLQRLVLVAHEGFAFSRDFAPKMKVLNKIGNRTEGLTNTFGLSGKPLICLYTCCSQCY